MILSEQTVDLIDRSTRIALDSLPRFMAEQPKYREIVRREVAEQVMARQRAREQ